MKHCDGDYIRTSILTWTVLFCCGLFIHSSGQSIIGNSWDNVRIGGGGFVTSIVASQAEEGLLYARTDVGGAYRWSDADSRWIPIMDWVSTDQRALMGVESVAIDPSDPARLYITAGLSGYGWPGASLLISDDYGETFTVKPMPIYIHGNGMGRQTGEKLQVDPNNGSVIYIGTRQDGMLKSEDRGESWEPLSSFPVETTPNINGVSFIILDPNSNESGETQRLIAGVSRAADDNIFISNDAGQTWAPIPNAPLAVDIMPHRAVLTDDGKVLYVTYANGAGPHPQNWDGVNELMNRGAVFKLNLETFEWTDISPIDLWQNPVSSGCYGGISISRQDNNTLYVSTVNHWNQQQHFLDGSSAWGDRIFVTRDGGDSWISLFEMTASPLRLDNNGIDWISGHNLHWAGCLTVDPFDDSRLFAISGNGIFMSENASSDAPVMKFMVEGLEETVPFDMVSIPEGPLVSVVGDYDGWVHDDIFAFPAGLRHTPNMGTTTGLAFSWNNPDILVRSGSSNSVLYHSGDQGMSWQAFDNLPISAVNGRVAVSSDGEVHLVAWIPEGQPDKFYMTTNFGGTWTNLWNSAYGSIANAHPYADAMEPRRFYVYAAGRGMLYQCTYPQIGMPEVEALAEFHTGGSPHLAVNPYNSGEVWIAVRHGGIVHYNNGMLDTIRNMRADAVTVGKLLEEAGTPTLFAWGEVKDTEGMYRSIDRGRTWFRMNDDAHQYAGLGNAGLIHGDLNVFGRVYATTAGRGIVVGDSGLDTLYFDPDDQTSGIAGLSVDLPLSFGPHPFRDALHLSAGESAVAVVAYDLHGRVVYHHRAPRYNHDINTAGWPPGIYFLRVAHESGRKTRLIKLTKAK